jgi:hypothetical protein
MAEKSMFAPKGGGSFKDRFAPRARVKRGNFIPGGANAGSASIVQSKPQGGTPAPPYRPSFSSAFSNIGFNS